jgi:hypothetical protein
MEIVVYVTHIFSSKCRRLQNVNETQSTVDSPPMAVPTVERMRIQLCNEQLATESHYLGLDQALDNHNQATMAQTQ